jgi:hypothetical protein
MGLVRVAPQASRTEIHSGRYAPPARYLGVPGQIAPPRLLEPIEERRHQPSLTSYTRKLRPRVRERERDRHGAIAGWAGRGAASCATG